MKRREVLMLGLAIISVVNLAAAADKADPTGTWKWTFTIQEQKRDMTLKLKLDGEKLAGTLLGSNDNKESTIDDATFKDGEISFSVARDRDGQKFVVKYKGKLDGATIKGKSESNRAGQIQTRDWEATRDKA